MNARAGVVLVTYNSCRFIGAAVDSCLREKLEVVVVDNASSDGTAAEVQSRPAVRLIQNARNRGFAAAVNQGFQALQSDFVLLLNPDAELISGVAAMTSELSQSAAVGGLLVGPDGQPQKGFAVRRFPTVAALAFEALGLNRVWAGNPVNKRYRCADLSLREACDVEQPAGAFLMVRREAWQGIGGFDEQFFPVWFEDVDFCLRLKQAGYRIRYTPLAVARHEGGHSVGAIADGPRQLYWYGGLLRFVNKHFHAGPRRVVCVAVAIGSLLRMITGSILGLSIRPIPVYATVIRLAFRFYRCKQC